MGEVAKFCGSCGAPLEARAGFCGVCGWRVPESPHAAPPDHKPAGDMVAAEATPARMQTAPKALPPLPKTNVETPVQPPAEPQPVPPAPVADSPAVSAAPVRVNRIQRLVEALANGLLWGMIWLLGWAPLGVFMGAYWTDHRARFKEFYDTYAPVELWGQTIPGATVAFAVGGLAGGLLAGTLLKWVIPEVRASAGVRAWIVLALWIVGYALAIGYPAASHYSGAGVNDDTFGGLILISTPLIAAIAAGVVLRRPRQARVADKAGGRRRLMLGLGWILASLVGLIVVAVISDV